MTKWAPPNRAETRLPKSRTRLVQSKFATFTENPRTRRTPAAGGQLYYAVAASRLYAEPKRLERLGYVSSEKRPGKTRERTFYTLTDRGREALRRWVLEPPALPRIQNEAVPKLLSGDILGDDEQLLASLLTLRDEIEGIKRGSTKPGSGWRVPAPEELPAAHPRAGRPAPPGPARVARRRGTGVGPADTGRRR